jgi:type II secretory pathway pseudopilin PulG
MSLVVIIVIGLVAASLVAVLVLVGARASKLALELEAAERKLEAAKKETRAVVTDLAKVTAEDQQKFAWLTAAEEQVKHLESELARRPKLVRKTYRILTLGVKATGKTSLTLKWANPLANLGLIEGTKIERYERSVSHKLEKDQLVEHLFEVHDWGGEHIVDAQQELIVEEIHGLLVVVDLGGKDARQVEQARIQEQLQEFQPQALKYFFGPKTVATCKTVVLFINKSDLLSGTPAQVEEQAKQIYKPLIDNLMKYCTQIDVRVFVGSASYGHSTHLLFSHFVERILPRSAYDPQLLQRMKTDFAGTRVPQLAPPPVPPSSPALPPATPQSAPLGQIVSYGANPVVNGALSGGLGDTAPLMASGNGISSKTPRKV